MGTSISSDYKTRNPEDHPHAYGDKLFHLTNAQICIGSSPRVWGQVTVTGVATDTVRIIPTRMGTRNGVLYIFAPVGDHPHAYGDKLIKDIRE